MEDFNWLAGLSGLVTGVLVASLVMYINYRIGKKQRRYDERYEQIHNWGKAIAWSVTVLALVIGWGVIIVVEGASLAFFILSGIYVISMVAYAIGAAYASTKY
ncbi:DUF3796 domain-containing protein [Chungangia koreensis]|uniref:DUF3796 domain-containing protein n=1 Tax=Chungangia koreensis TaxID=752657 RepID=A0ABV8X705_9LACT